MNIIFWGYFSTKNLTKLLYFGPSFILAFIFTDFQAVSSKSSWPSSNRTCPRCSAWSKTLLAIRWTKNERKKLRFHAWNHPKIVVKCRRNKPTSSILFQFVMVCEWIRKENVGSFLHIQCNFFSVKNFLHKNELLFRSTRYGLWNLLFSKRFHRTENYTV